MLAHTGEGPEGHLITDSMQAKQDDWSEATQKNRLYVSDSICHKGTTLSEPTYVCFFPQSKHLFHHFPSLCWNSFFQSRCARALSPATGNHGLVARIWPSHCHGLASITGQGIEILLRGATDRGHPRSHPDMNLASSTQQALRHIILFLTVCSVRKVIIILIFQTKQLKLKESIWKLSKTT